MDFIDIVLAVGIVSTLFLIVQVVLLFIGADSDIDCDIDVDTPDFTSGFGLKLLTLKNITTFTVMSSWTFLLMNSMFQDAFVVSCIVSLIVGGVSMILMSFAMASLMKLQKDGTSKITSLKDCEGTVSITIRGERSSRGKISIMLHGSLSEIDAESDEELIPGVKVLVVEAYENYVVVKKIGKED